MIEIEAYVNADNEWNLQIPAIDGQPATTFEPTDTLACSVWQGQSQAVITSPTAEWLQEVSAIALIAPGSGYTTAPTVTISGGGATTDATAYATIANGAVTGFFMTSSGEGYDGSAVSVSISGGGGTGASGTAVVTLGWQTGIVSVVLGSAASAGLTPGGTYRFQVIITRDVTSAPVIDGLLKVVATPGDTPPNPSDLITYDYAESHCEILGLTDAQRDLLPTAVTAASKAIIKWCSRPFAIGTYVEDLQPALDGFVRLKAIPINQVIRIQALPQQALTIQNTAAQIAYVAYAYTGDVADGTSAITGLNFTSVINGVQVVQPVIYSVNETISGVATAIGLLGNGWQPFLNAAYGLWPVTELIGGWVSQDATLAQGVILNVYSQGVSDAQFDPDDGQLTGMLWVGRQNNDAFGPRWGPDYAAWSSGEPLNGQVRVTYNGGFSTIPLPVQLATAETVKAIMERLKIENYLESEKGGDYMYKIALDKLNHLPRQAVTALAGYRVHNA